MKNELKGEAVGRGVAVFAMFTPADVYWALVASVAPTRSDGSPSSGARPKLPTYEFLDQVELRT